MIITIFQADAFADTLFKGNPAAICLLPHWIPDFILQKIALGCWMFCSRHNW